MSGYGILTGEDGFRYEGEWLAGEITGKGIATYSNGDVYEGTFVNGRRQGQGTIKFANGRSAKGNWQDGALIDSETSVTDTDIEASTGNE